MGEGRTLRVYGKEAEMREGTSRARERGPGEDDMRILWQRIKVDCVKSEQTREGMWNCVVDTSVGLWEAHTEGAATRLTN